MRQKISFVSKSGQSLNDKCRQTCNCLEDQENPKYPSGN